MANRIYGIETVELQDWNDESGNAKPIKIFPLVLKKFKQLSEILNQINVVNEEEPEKTYMDVLIEGAAFCMQTFESELSDPEKLEDHIDYPTMTHILEIAGGIKLNDPNLQAAIAAGRTS